MGPRPLFGRLTEYFFFVAIYSIAAIPKLGESGDLSGARGRARKFPGLPARLAPCRSVDLPRQSVRATLAAAAAGRRGMQHRTLTFADFELDLETLELRRAGTLISIQRKPLEVLAHLLRHPARIVSKDELLRQVWPDVSVSEDALTSALRDLRRGLGDTNSPHRVIVTVRGQGYRFLGSAAEGERFAGSHPALDARRSRPENTFVDRGQVMLELEASLHTALSGERRVSLLAGPAGIGKTRTALELVGLARQLGVDVHLARCYGGQGAMPFWPWLESSEAL